MQVLNLPIQLIFVLMSTAQFQISLMQINRRGGSYSEIWKYKFKQICLYLKCMETSADCDQFPIGSVCDPYSEPAAFPGLSTFINAPWEMYHTKARLHILNKYLVGRKISIFWTCRCCLNVLFTDIITSFVFCKFN